MRLKITSILLIFFTMFASIGCNNQEKEKDIELTPPMAAFMRLLDDPEVPAKKAFDEYAIPDLSEDERIYDIKDAKVISKDGPCYTLEGIMNDEMHVKYKVCWENELISDVIYLGLDPEDPYNTP